MAKIAEGLRPPAPPYRGEGPHALWHYSEDPGIEVFRPHVAASNPENVEPLVWAVDTRHAPMFWFPRDCPRGCTWIDDETTDKARQRIFANTQATRLHVIETAWLARVQAATVWAYRLPEATFERHQVGGYWVSRETVEPLEVLLVGDLLLRHAEAGIELRVTPSIWPWWAAVIRSGLNFSGSRLRNCTEPEPDWVRLPTT